METSEMELKVKVMYGDDVIIHCNGNDLVKHLKEILEEKTGIPVDHQSNNKLQILSYLH